MHLKMLIKLMEFNWRFKMTKPIKKINCLFWVKINKRKIIIFCLIDR